VTATPADLPPQRDPEQPADSCRYWRKKEFVSKAQAYEGARQIRLHVELTGRTYDPLYPYLCPDGDHWHLSHYRQGEATCSHCGETARAWRGGADYWVIGEHSLANGQPCSGEKTQVYDQGSFNANSGSTQ